MGRSQSGLGVQCVRDVQQTAKPLAGLMRTRENLLRKDLGRPSATALGVGSLCKQRGGRLGAANDFAEFRMKTS
jgi:hypothetical protein